MFELTDLHRSMVIVGMGIIGLELGQSLARMGIEITGFDQDARVAGIADPEVDRSAIELMREERAAKYHVKAANCGADTTKATDIERMIKTANRELGKVDIVVNNAGIRSCRAHDRSAAQNLCIDA